MAKVKGLAAVVGTIGGGNSHQRRLRRRHPGVCLPRLNRQEQRRQKNAERLGRQEQEYRARETEPVNFRPAGWDTLAGLELEPGGFFRNLRLRLSAWFRRG